MKEKLDSILEIIGELEQQHVNDPRFSDQLDELVDILSEEEKEASQILEGLTEEQLMWLTPIFEELSFAFQSQNFISLIEKLAEKYPDITGIDDDVIAAKEALD